MMFVINASCGSFLGNRRSKNEDNFYFNKKSLSVPNKGLKSPIECKCSVDEPVVFALFDGMGGEKMGDNASYVASQVFDEECTKLQRNICTGKEFMYKTCEKANLAVNEFRQKNKVTTVGTTVAAVYIENNEVFACNVGDSKIFRIRDNTMTQISDDHTDEKLIAAMGLSKKPVLLQYLGVPDTEMAIDPCILKGDLQKNDVYILATDGVTGVLDNNEIYEIVCENDAKEAVSRLLSEVRIKNGEDNATVIVVKVI